MQGLLRNLKILPWFSALRNFDALLPFFVLYTQQCGLTYFDFFITQIVFSIVLVMLDIPLGLCSDIFGRKICLTMGAFATCIGLGFFVLWPAFWGFVFGEIALAISFAAFSGADTSLLFETTKKLKQQESYAEQEGKCQSYARYSEGLSSIIGGLFASVSLFLPALMSWLFSILSFILTLLLQEQQKVGLKDFSKEFKHEIHHKISSIKLYFKLGDHQRVFWILIYSGTLSAMIINIFWLLQVFLKNYHFNFFIIGFIYFIYHSTSGFIASYTSKWLKYSKEVLWLMPVVFQAMIIVLGLSQSAWFLPIFLIASMIYGIKMTFIYTLLHQQVEDNVRATILSFDSVVTRLSFSLLALPMGWLLDHASFNWAFLFLTLPNLVVLWIGHTKSNA